MNNEEEKYKENFSITLNALFDKKEWVKAKELLESEINKFPNEYFLYTSLAKVYFNLKQYQKASEAALMAVSIEPNDPLVVYDYACTLYSLDKYNEAINEWFKIVNLGVKGILHGEYNEGIKWTKSIVNDSRFRIAMCYFEMGNKEIARKFVDDHLKHRQRGIYSDFTKRQILKKQHELS
ncbi:MAG TPA: CDC27 family protein [Bacteroidales bacterium]|jgi:Tfp pilus assembly protein PilF|nr:CDC27 family protein [Bacteroidales bacterium]HOX77391.1 CDC27 family protein [Bacteroidales bacterium]HPM93186.1 CDC27 family protein [Bacteroidales bacterium]